MNTIVVIAFPACVALIGMLVYAFAANPKAAELGRVAFACGLLVTLFQVATERISL